ncbi:MAG: glycosyl hydrolase family 18 protein, partial [Chloroflexota bacterium]
FGVQVSQVDLTSFESGSGAAGEWIPAVRNAVPYYLALQSSVYSVDTVGDAPDSTFLSLRTPNNIPNTDLLDMYGWYGDATVGEWRFIPSQPSENRLETVVEDVPSYIAIFQVAPDVPEVVVSYDVATALDPEVARVATVVAPGGLQPRVDGTVSGSLAAGSDANGDYRWMPIIRNFNDPRSVDAETVSTIISNPAVRAAHINQLTMTTNNNGFDGLMIDYRGLPAEQRDNFTAFISELASSLQAQGRVLGVVVPAANNVDGLWETGAYDWRALGSVVDLFEVQLGINPQFYTANDNQLVEAMLGWAVGEVDRTKILLNVSALSVRDIAGNLTPIGYDEALAGLGSVRVEADNISETGTIEPGTTIRATLDGREAIGSYDEALNSPYLDYVDEDGNTTARIWVTTGSALRFRMNWTERLALGGVGFDDLLGDGVADGVVQAIGEYSAQIPTPITMAEWALRWRIVDANGEVVQTETTALDADLEITLEAPDGNYAINPAVILNERNTEQESVRTGAEVALFSATSTPTPRPTATPTPVPTMTPTVAPVVATNPPVVANTGGQVTTNANPLGAGVILSGFEYGGHVTSTSSQRAITAMQSAGMTWMKIQVRHNFGADPSGAIASIQNGQAAGFRVLVGTVGNPTELGNNTDAYIQDFARWIGGIAAGGADAIEVWNEPNIDREWPTGQISGQAYVNLLAPASNAIRSANPGTFIILGAAAPTGAEAAFPGQVVNDNTWLSQVASAGGMAYVDCIGVHYNEGIVPPTATGGDIRDNYYTRYLPTMVNVYTGLSQGKPLCFTELGYVTSEGYPPLPAFFDWGSGNTLAEQSAWLAQAAAYLSQQGNVRMMIVWNVDFTLYAGDPQGGYAIIRPDGSCPACSALSSAR